MAACFACLYNAQFDPPGSGTTHVLQPFATLCEQRQASFNQQSSTVSISSTYLLCHRYLLGACGFGNILQGECFVNNGKEIFALERKARIALLDPLCDGLWHTSGSVQWGHEL